jgi:hypothetical protein
MKNYCIPFFLFFVGVSKSIAWNPLYFHHVPISQGIKNHKSNIVHLDMYDLTTPIGTKTFGFAESEEESMMVNFFDENGALELTANKMHALETSKKDFDVFEFVDNLNLSEKSQVAELKLFYFLEKGLSNFLQFENDAKNSKRRENKNVSKHRRGPLRPSTRKISELLPSIDSLDDQTILDNYLNERENTEALVVPRKLEKRISTKFKKKKNGFKHKSNE